MKKPGGKESQQCKRKKCKAAGTGLMWKAKFVFSMC